MVRKGFSKTSFVLEGLISLNKRDANSVIVLGVKIMASASFQWRKLKSTRLIIVFMIFPVALIVSAVIKN